MKPPASFGTALRRGKKGPVRGPPKGEDVYVLYTILGLSPHSKDFLCRPFQSIGGLLVAFRDSRKVFERCFFQGLTLPETSLC